jgi:hypothetical protein
VGADHPAPARRRDGHAAAEGASFARSWALTLQPTNERTFHGRTLEEALAWCLVWLMAPELEIGPSLVGAPQRLASVAGVLPWL